MNLLRWLPDWITHRFLTRWFRVEVTDPEEIARIKEEFGIEVWIAPLPPEADCEPGSWVEPKGKP